MSFDTEIVELWGIALWRASRQGAAFALVAWTVCRLAPTIPPRFQAWLWRLAAVKFLVALAWWSPIEFAVLPAPPQVAWSEAEEADGPVFIAASPGASAADSARPIPWQSIVCVVWAVIVVGGSVRLAQACMTARRLRRGARACEDFALLEDSARLSRAIGLGSSPTLLEIDGDGSPLLVGLLRPAIVFPTTTLGRLDAAERTLVLGHELAHLRRSDLAWSFVAAVVRCLFFFHPLAWLCERRLRWTQELAADEAAISLRRENVAGYAAVLVSVVAKLGPARLLPAMSAGVSGSQATLSSRFEAMRFIQPTSRFATLTYGVVLAIVTVPTIASWTLVPAEAVMLTAAAEASEPNEGDSPVEKPKTKGEKNQAKDEAVAAPISKEKVDRGRFVTFKNRVLTVEANSGAHVSMTMSSNLNFVIWDGATSTYKPANPRQALAQAKAGTWTVIQTGTNSTTVRFGAPKGSTAGTFVSFKEGRLLILGKNSGGRQAKNNGRSLHFNTFRADVPAFASIDGSEYRPIGTANEVLGDVKEGSIITVHGEGDDNITLVQIGVPKK